ncbi:hypothetical protein GF337_02610 [candidate division KSB1 bacterium]|nr:hypothetical protein [candidate division KSB1 bacterium]
MTIKHITPIVLLLTILILAIYIGSCTERTFEEEPLPLQEEEVSESPRFSDEQDTILQEDRALTQDEINKAYKILYKQNTKGPMYLVHGFYWPKITALDTVSAVIFFVALTIGIVSYFIGHNAGGRENKGQIFFAVGIATAVGILGRSIILFLQILIFRFLMEINFLDFNPLTIASIVEFIFYTFWTLFIAGISVYLYETFTVTAKEIYQGG